MLLLPQNETLKLVISALNESFKRGDFIRVREVDFRTNKFTLENILFRIIQQKFQIKFVFK